jgi:hypothetical protein
VEKVVRTRKLSERFIIGNMSMLLISGARYLVGLVELRFRRRGPDWRVL